MLNKVLTPFFLALLFLLNLEGSGNPITQKTSDNQNQVTGILQKLIVENGTVTMDLDLNRLSGIRGAPQEVREMRFDVAANSFFSVLVFNDLLRGPEQGSMALIQVGTAASAPGASSMPLQLNGSLNRLAIEKLPSGQQFDLAVRDAVTGFTFFNIEGHH
jgi:hypothetical protein